MVEVGDWFGIGSIGLTVVLLWRIWRIEITLKARVDELDYSLAIIVQQLVERMDNLKEMVPSVNLINQNPFSQVLEFLKSRNPENQNAEDEFISRTPNEIEPEFIEVTSNATEKEERI
jgi:hypothetical protein